MELPDMAYGRPWNASNRLLKAYMKDTTAILKEQRGVLCVHVLLDAPIQAKAFSPTPSWFHLSHVSPGFYRGMLVWRVTGSILFLSHHGTQCPIIPPFSDSRFLRALIWARWSVFVEVRSRISGESKLWVMCPVVLRPLSASLPFLDPSIESLKSL